jgi:hypothetical protein
MRRRAKQLVRLQHKHFKKKQVVFIALLSLFLRHSNGHISRVFVTFSSPLESQKCLTDHLEPLQKWRISQLEWYTRLSGWKRRLTDSIIFFSGPVVLGFRMLVFLLQSTYAVVSAFGFMVIDTIIRNNRKLNQEHLTPKVFRSELFEIPLPGSADDQANLASPQNDSLFASTLFESSVNSLIQVAESLQRPVILRCQKLLEVFSVSARQPVATLYSIVRMWLNFCIFVSECDLAFDKYYRERSERLQEHMSLLDVKHEVGNCIGIATTEQQNQHGLVVTASDPAAQSTLDIGDKLQHGQVDCDISNATDGHTLLSNDDSTPTSIRPPPIVPRSDSGFQDPEHETISRTTSTSKGSPKIIAALLRLRRPREPWLLLWGNLHISKVQQVVPDKL